MAEHRTSSWAINYSDGSGPKVMVSVETANDRPIKIEAVGWDIQIEAEDLEWLIDRLRLAGRVIEGRST